MMKCPECGKNHRYKDTAADCANLVDFRWNMRTFNNAPGAELIEFVDKMNKYWDSLDWSPKMIQWMIEQGID